jgi:GDP-L-fucose synthase
MRLDSRIYIAGHRGLVGSALVRACDQRRYTNLIVRERAQLDLRDAYAVSSFFSGERPEYVFLAAGTVGGIHANNTRPADFLLDNLLIAANVIDAAWRHGVRKLLFLGSSCIYPKLAPQPLREDRLLSGPLEPTNEWYAVAKLAGLKMCQAYRRQHNFDAITLLPTNLYGPGDNFDLDTSHVLAALLRKIDTARSRGIEHVTLWGSGTPRREFLFVDDLADACLFLMQHYSDERPINVGCGEDLSIHELAALIARVIGYTGRFEPDLSRPDGTPRKVLDVSRLAALGWHPQVDLQTGIRLTHDWYQRSISKNYAAHGDDRCAGELHGARAPGPVGHR